MTQLIAEYNAGQVEAFWSTQLSRFCWNGTMWQMPSYVPLLNQHYCHLQPTEDPGT